MNHVTVTAITTLIKQTLDRSAGLQNVWVQGEISNFKKHSRGHMYFTLKDDKSRLQSVMFAGNNRSLAFAPDNGMKVLVRGDISVYEPFGQYQFYVKEMQPDGIGHLYMAFEQLKKKLEAEGLFLPDHKKKIPKIPERIAVITSPTGAAVRDIVTTIRRRYPLAAVTLLPVLVQGPGAPASIVSALRQADETESFDVIIAGRGGGSLEELWAFNEEEVARTIFSMSTPVISAVGHETDVTISDFTADLRAPTPTAAAELAVPDIQDMRAFVMERHTRLLRAVKLKIDRKQEQLKALDRSYAFQYPRRLLEQKEQELDIWTDKLRRALQENSQSQRNRLEKLEQRLLNVHPQRAVEKEKNKLLQFEQAMKTAMRRQHDNSRHRLDVQLSKLELLSPLQLMRKGYSLTYDKNGGLLKSVKDIAEGDTVSLTLQDGRIYASVENVIREEREDR
ncbi:exodeoxyribonuclease VII large subunit [Alkalicoccus luteus]|uniref:Exodeoxyribonuclease 7 large subunit n=1 Tax=Alkalicoccus luteus TaxID=1237094 RepID=A0A969PQQ3_9BACI|nr:exodeoxyribonuclease VII large subunit [Alkalicoccus luteus]NJP37633.1 exodeoxyribonuclease VII large subunit [Alkalicoccus luteus]